MKLEKQQYSIEVELDAPLEECFKAAMEAEIMKKWIPDVKDIIYNHSAAEAPYHAGSVRDIVMANGQVIQERINYYEPPHQCGYEIDSMGFFCDSLFSNYHGLISFEAINENKTRFTWQGDFDCKGLQKITEPLARKMVYKVIYKMVERIQKYFSTTGK